MSDRGYDELSVSDGTGEAVVMNIENDRAISAATLDVDSVENLPNKFIVVTGDKTVENYIDPNSMTVMYGHEDSGDIVIDGYAPGYTDTGNTSGQIAVIKPTTYQMDELVRLARVAHDNDGRQKRTNYDSAYTEQSIVSTVSIANINLVGSTLTAAFSFEIGSAMGDGSTNLVQLDLSAMGIASISRSFACGYSDGGNGIVQIDTTSAGMARSVGVEPADLSSGDFVQFTIVANVTGWV